LTDEIKLDWVFRTTKDPLVEMKDGFWGDYAPWTSYLPLAWATIDMRDFTVRPRAAQVNSTTLHTHAIATWGAAVHLLGLGLGWTDLTAGLIAWKRERFSEGLHPILDSVKRLVGDDIEALELYFGKSPRAIIQALREIEAVVSGGPAFEPYMDFSTGDYDELTEIWLGHVPRPKASLGALLLSGGDGLHLDGHMHAMLLERGIDLARSQVRQDFGTHSVITMNKYHGWGHRLAAQTRDLLATPLGDFANKSVEVKIQQLGSLGTFAFDAETSRWFRYSSDYRTAGFQLQNEIHRWGRQK
jgi:hypothetical protein